MEFDVLIFDISSADSENIALIEDLKFEGDIVVFAAADLLQEVIANLSKQVTEKDSAAIISLFSGVSSSPALPDLLLIKRNSYQSYFQLLHNLA